MGLMWTLQWKMSLWFSWRKVCVVRGDVDAEDNLLTTEDIYNVLHYGNGIPNANISQVVIYDKNPIICNKTSILKDQSIPY